MLEEKRQRTRRKFYRVLGNLKKIKRTEGDRVSRRQGKCLRLAVKT